MKPAPPGAMVLAAMGAEQQRKQRLEEESAQKYAQAREALAGRIKAAEDLVAAYQEGLPKAHLRHIYNQVTGYYEYLDDAEEREEKDLRRGVRKLATATARLEALLETQRLLEKLSGEDLRKL